MKSPLCCHPPASTVSATECAHFTAVRRPPLTLAVLSGDRQPSAMSRCDNLRSGAAVCGDLRNATEAAPSLSAGTAALARRGIAIWEQVPRSAFVRHGVASHSARCRAAGSAIARNAARSQCAEIVDFRVSQVAVRATRAAIGGWITPSTPRSHHMRTAAAVGGELGTAATVLGRPRGGAARGVARRDGCLTEVWRVKVSQNGGVHLPAHFQQIVLARVARWRSPLPGSCERLMRREHLPCVVNACYLRCYETQNQRCLRWVACASLHAIELPDLLAQSCSLAFTALSSNSLV